MNTITMPGSKSLTNRALIVASLTNGRSIIRGHSKSNDCIVLIKALQKLGIKIIERKNKLIITGNGGNFKPFAGNLNLADAGTSMRFLRSLIILVPGNVVLKGSKRLLQRPLEELTTVLSHAKTGKVTIKGTISSQFISSLLMIAPLLKNGLIIKIIGKQVSKSYIDMTINLQRKFGVAVKNNSYKSYEIRNQKYRAIDFQVEADASGASYFWGIAAVTGKTIRVQNINPRSCQGDVTFPKLLEKMGCTVKENLQSNWIQVKGSKVLKGININMNSMPDTAQTLAVVAAFAKGKTKITGLKTLKIKETDRLKALKNELKKIGINSHITNDSITVLGGSPQPAEIETYNDHRMAMAFAITKAKIPEIKIKNPEVVKKSFPEFWEKFNSIIL